MVDRLTTARRSWLMSRVGSRHTKPELEVRSIVHRLGYRFRLHAAGIRGRPDLVFPAQRKLIFVHGCFWHGHANCAKGRLPKSNKVYWRTKIRLNRARDSEITRSLKKERWKILVVWSCQLKNKNTLRRRL